MTQYVKMNYMSEIQYMKDLWQCDSCQTRPDLNDDLDMATYLHDVMLIRSKLDIQK